MPTKVCVHYASLKPGVKSYQTLVCNSLYLINARSLPLFLLHPSFCHFSPRFFSFSSFFPFSSLSKSERRDLRGPRAWGNGCETGAPSPSPGAAGAGHWSPGLSFANFSRNRDFHPPFCDPGLYGIPRD